MLKQLKKRMDGFTIIEVMIVLAIAGLILLIIFLAVPALQRNSRNTQRKNDVSAVLGGITEYSNNNSGQLPAVWNATGSGAPGFASATTASATQVKLGYYQSNGTTNNIIYTVNTSQATSPAGTNVSNVYIETYAKCNTTNNGNLAPTSGTGSATATARSVAVVYWIDTAAGTQQVCQEN